MTINWVGYKDWFLDSVTAQFQLRQLYDSNETEV
jgi:hypothetical protein